MKAIVFVFAVLIASACGCEPKHAPSDDCGGNITPKKLAQSVEDLRDVNGTLQSRISDLEWEVAQLRAGKKADKSKPKAIFFVNRNCKLWSVHCPQCKAEVCEVAKDGQGFWWKCAVEPLDNHHLAHGGGCKQGTCPKCGMPCCVSQERH